MEDARGPGKGFRRHASASLQEVVDFLALCVRHLPDEILPNEA